MRTRPAAALLFVIALGCKDPGIAASSGDDDGATATGTIAPLVDAGPGCDPPPDSPPSGGSCMAPPGTDAGLIRSATCNPVTGADCDLEAGESCDSAIDASGEVVGFQCYRPPNEVPVCEPCNYREDAFCAPRTTCVAGRCLAFCCSNDDCAGASCVTALPGGKAIFEAAPNLGVCSTR